MTSMKRAGSKVHLVVFKTIVFTRILRGIVLNEKTTEKIEVLNAIALLEP